MFLALTRRPHTLQRLQSLLPYFTQFALPSTLLLTTWKLHFQLYICGYVKKLDSSVYIYTHGLQLTAYFFVAYLFLNFQENDFSWASLSLVLNLEANVTCHAQVLQGLIHLVSSSQFPVPSPSHIQDRNTAGITVPDTQDSFWESHTVITCCAQWHSISCWQ